MGAGETSNGVRALVLAGYGLNCDYETEHIFRLAGAETQRVHINELISRRVRLHEFHIFAFIGGFAWADDHGAGVILATKLRHHLGDEILRFVESGRLVIGICNGFQALVNLGLLPGFARGTFRREVALTYNDCGNFRNQWVHLRAEDSPCVFTRGIRRLDLPVRHAEGKFVAAPEALDRLRDGRQIVLRYALPDGTPAGGSFPWNPNGSLGDVAGICDPSGRIFGLMPHPEAYNHRTNHPDWTRWQWGERGAAEGLPGGAGGGERRAEAATGAGPASTRDGPGATEVPAGTPEQGGALAATRAGASDEGAGVAIFRNAVAAARRELLGDHAPGGE